MHVITQSRVWAAAIVHKDCALALDTWYRLVKHNRFTTFAELKDKFGSVDKVGEFCVFNVGGNKLRVICAVHFNTGKVFIRHILTHKEYDTDAWKM